MVERWDNVVTGPLGERMITFLDRYPKADKVHITSAMDGDHGSVSHHYGLWYKGSRTAAIDIGAKNAKRMRDVAQWLYDNFAALTVELIHTTPFNDDDGFYVKNQVKYPGGSIYGNQIMKEHRNHVHWATSAALMTVIERWTEPQSTRESAARVAEELDAADHQDLLAIVADLKQRIERLEELLAENPPVTPEAP